MLVRGTGGVVTNSAPVRTGLGTVTSSAGERDEQETLYGSCNASDDFPFNQGRGSVDLQMAARDQMSLEVEGIVDGGVSREKSLCCTWFLEANPTSFSSSNRPMRVLCAIVRPTTGDKEGAVYRHKKRGSTYEIIDAHAQIQTGRPIDEGERVVVYQGLDGQTWVRLFREFADGRFEEVEPGPQAEASDGS